MYMSIEFDNSKAALHTISKNRHSYERKKDFSKTQRKKMLAITSGVKGGYLCDAGYVRYDKKSRSNYMKHTTNRLIRRCPLDEVYCCGGHYKRYY